MGVTFSGKSSVLSLLSGQSTNNLDYFGIGASGIAFADYQVGLGSELFPSGTGTLRNALSTIRLVDNYVELSSFLKSDQLIGGSIQEIGLFFDSSGGTMFSRQNEPLKLKTGSIEYYEIFRVLVDQV